MQRTDTIDRLLDTILEKVTSDGIKKALRRKPYRASDFSAYHYPLFQDKAGYALQIGDYTALVLETSVRIQYPCTFPANNPVLPDDKGKRMCLTVRRGNRNVLEAHKYIWERKELSDIYRKWDISHNKAAEALLESLC